MKKCLFILLMVLPLLLGQTAILNNEITIAWDAVEPMGDDTIEYEVFYATLGDYGSAQSLGVTPDLSMYIDVGVAEGEWVFGVRTVRTIISTGAVSYSTINWSDVNGVSTPNPFYLSWITAPAAPSNLRAE